MGYASNGFCFPDADSAAQYVCGRVYPLASSVVDATGHVASVLIECTGSSGNVLTLQRDLNGVVDGVSTLAITSPACDETAWLTFHPWAMSADQGAAIGAAVIAVWAVGWGWRAIFSVLRGGSSLSSDSDE